MKKHKKLLIAIISIVLVAAIGAGIWFGTRGKSESVGVYPFDQVGMTEYWGDSQQSYGPITTDKIQTIFLSDTQTVTEILVNEGDEVKKGDLLMTFDTTLSDLALERKRLEVEKLKLDLETAQKELATIKAMKPMVIYTYESTGDEDTTAGGTQLTSAYRVSTDRYYDGSAAERALICWLRSDASVDDGLLETIRQAAENFQNQNALENAGSTGDGDTDAQSETDETGGTDDGETGGSTYEPFEVYGYYVIFKVTSGNMSLGSRITWQGLKVSGSGTDFSFRFFDAYGVPDHMAALEDEDAADTSDQPSIDYGSGYTAAQIAEMRSAKEKEISELEFKIKMADAEYKIAQTEMADGNIYAEFDGKVTSVLTEEEAKEQGVAVLKVSGGGGYYINCSVGELDKDSMVMGQEVTVNDWNTGATYTGTVVEIGDFPTDDSGWGNGNPNVSYYPLTVFVDETAELQAGMYADITFSAGTSQHGIYLRNPFLRTEGGESYVLVMGKNNKLEKRTVTVGKSLWGSYTEILSGLTEEDLVAFPYGKNVKEGAPAEEGDVADLYNY